MTIVGDPDCAGAIFILKGDGTELSALHEASKVAHDHRVKGTYTGAERAKIVSRLRYDPTDRSGNFVYVVQTNDILQFKDLLSAWHARTRQQDTSLLIYGHMGDEDIGPTPDGAGVTWRELGEILEGGVSSLWLVGCESDNCMTAWGQPPYQHPVKNWLISTNTSVFWLPLIPYFSQELSMTPIVMPEELAANLEDAFPGQVRVRRRADQWVQL